MEETAEVGPTVVGEVVERVLGATWISLTVATTREVETLDAVGRGCHRRARARGRRAICEGYAMAGDNNPVNPRFCSRFDSFASTEGQGVRLTRHRAQQRRTHPGAAYDGPVLARRRLLVFNCFTKRMVCGEIPLLIGCASLEEKSPVQVLFGVNISDEL